MESASLIEHDTGQDAREIALVDPAGFEAWRDALPARARAAVEAAQFKGAAGTRVILPGSEAESWSAAFGAPATPDDQIGLLTGIDNNRLRLEIPGPVEESTYDIIEFAR